MKIIATVPVRNEAWILPLFLGALEKLVDVIIVADQGSDDESMAIYSRFPKVEVIANNSGFGESYRFQLLLDAARNFEGNNLIIALDADEVFTGDVLHSSIETISEILLPGQSAELQWIWLWNDATTYRTDGINFNANWRPCIFKDDRCSQFAFGRIHQHRIPVAIAMNKVRFDKPKVLHYQFANWNRALAKQRWYRCLERTMFPDKDPYAINAEYAWFLAGSNHPDLKPLPAEWLSPWRLAGLDAEHFPREELPWFEVEVLHMFREHGLPRFADLDIWDIDWELRRMQASRAGHHGLPDGPIIDPRSREQKIAQAFTRRTRRRPRWRLLPLLVRESVRRVRAIGRGVPKR